MKRAGTWVAGFALLAGLCTMTVRVQRVVNRPYLHEDLYLPSGKFIESLSLGFKQVVADIVWMSAVQYYGEYRMGNHGLGYFKGLIDITTKLDPHFIFVYEFGALVLSEDVGEFGSGMDLLKSGMAQNPTSWRLPFEIAFLNYVNHVNVEVAAHYFDLAARLPGAPERVKRFAAFAYSVSGEGTAAIRLWEEYLDQAENPYLRDLAQRYIQKLKAKQEIQPWRRDDS